MNRRVIAMNALEALHWRAVAVCIVRRRLAAGLTQEELADRAGLSRSEIQHIEHGRRYPRTGTLVRICDAFGISLPELVTEAERVKNELLAEAANAMIA